MSSAKTPPRGGVLCYCGGAMSNALYREEFAYSNKAFLAGGIILQILVACFMLGIASLFLIGSVIAWNPTLAVVGVGLIILFIVINLLINALTWKQVPLKQTVEYLDDHLVVRSEKEAIEINYRDIKRVWKGPVLSMSGRVWGGAFPLTFYVEEYPGLKLREQKAVWPNQMKQAGLPELLVRNSKIMGGLGLMLGIKPLIFEREGSGKVYLLETKDERKVVDILRRRASKAEFSPILDENAPLR